jgi:transposase
MLNMSRQSTIRQLHAKGLGVTEIARTVSCDRKTVYSYINQEDFSPKPPLRQVRPSILDPYREVIESWIEEEKSGFSKQRHTYQRIKERLKEECGFDCKFGTLSDFMRRHEFRTKVSHHASLDLVWQPGSAQADFGQADCMLYDTRVRMHFLVLSFPYSNIGFTQVFFAENAECICQGLTDIFHHLGGVPPLIVFDNATGIGRRIHGKFTEGELFGRLKAHYRFEARYCNPASGWEKGNVERKVALLRNELFVPAPIIDDIKQYNTELLLRCAFQEGRTHYAKGIRQGELFDKDSSALLTLPPKRFSAVRYESIRADGYGHVTVDGVHTYSGDPEYANAPLIVAVGAHTVIVLDEAGTVLSEHGRSFGVDPTESIDCLGQLRLLTARPRGFKNSKVREQLPKSVVGHLDALDAETLRRDLKLLYDTCERSGLAATLDALDVLASEHDSFPDFFQVGVLAARIASLGLDTEPLGGADLSCYDELFLGSVKDGQ